MGKAATVAAVLCAAAASLAATVIVAKRLRSRWSWNRAVCTVREFENACVLPTTRLRNLVDAMAVEMHAGLASEGGSKLKMLLTFVDRLPSRADKERGVFYAVDLKRTSLKLLQVNIGEGDEALITKSEQVLLPEYHHAQMTEELFDFIACSLDSFVNGPEHVLHTEPGKQMELGFSFPFPLKHQSISSGILLKCTKDFQIEDTIGKDIGECLEKALSNKGLNMRVAALVNDTVGTLTRAHFFEKDAMVAVMLSTETNACYVERSDAITKCQLSKPGFMAINMEWGNFWSSHLPWTSYDDDLLLSGNLDGGDQCLGRLISGMYFGEILRRVILNIVQQSDLFEGAIPERLLKTFVLDVFPHISAMLEDDSEDLKEVDNIMREVLGVPLSPLKLRVLVMEACNMVIERAAGLAAAGIVGILKKLGRDGSQSMLGSRVRTATTSTLRRTVVAIDSDLYERIPKFRYCLHSAIERLLGRQRSQNVILRQTKEASGIGAALIAAANSIYLEN